MVINNYYFRIYKKKKFNKLYYHFLPVTGYTVDETTINSGNIIALQATERYKWVSCWSNKCDTRTCPGLNMREVDSDYKRCLGEVFQIYRANGPGEVLVGDKVGIYYIHDKKWFGCYGSTCTKAPCPGAPTMEHGFSSVNRWKKCVGEVFQIYARGKNVGDIIHNKDDIRIYYPAGKDWVSHWQGTMHRNACPGKTLPPDVANYEGCWGETFKIWKKGIDECN